MRDTVASNNFGRSRQSVNISGRYASERAWAEGARKSASLRSLGARLQEKRASTSDGALGRRASRRGGVTKLAYEKKGGEGRRTVSKRREGEEVGVRVPGNGQRTEIKEENKEREREREKERERKGE